MEEIEIRCVDVDGESNWHWPVADEGAFTGPAQDWVDDYKEIHLNEVPKRGTIVTAGANCGMYARHYAKLYEHVYAFEPDHACFHCLTLNTPYSNVYKMQAFLGEFPQTIGIERTIEKNWGMHRVSHDDQVNKIPMITIDSLNLSECDVIQLDVEGFELDVLQGAQETIRKHRPLIQLERFDRDVNVAYMDSIGYHLWKSCRMDVFYKPNGT